MYADRPPRELLHQHRLPADLPLLPWARRRSARYYTSRAGTLVLEAHAGRLLRLPGARTSRTAPASGRASSRVLLAGRHPVLAPLRARGAARCGAATIRWRWCWRSARSTGRCTSTSGGPASSDVGDREARHGVRHVLLAARSRSRRSVAPRPLPLPDPAGRRLPEHHRAARAARGGARRARRHGPLRLADVVVARPHGDGRLRRQPHAPAEAVPEAALRDRVGPDAAATTAAASPRPAAPGLSARRVWRPGSETVLCGRRCGGSGYLGARARPRRLRRASPADTRARRDARARSRRRPTARLAEICKDAAAEARAVQAPGDCIEETPDSGPDPVIDARPAAGAQTRAALDAIEEVRRRAARPRRGRSRA